MQEDLSDGAIAESSDMQNPDNPSEQGIPKPDLWAFMSYNKPSAWSDDCWETVEPHVKLVALGAAKGNYAQSEITGDVIDEVWMALWKRDASKWTFDSGDHFKAFVSVIAKHKTIDLLRKQNTTNRRQRPIGDAFGEVDEDIPDPTGDPAGAVQDRLLLDEVTQLLANALADIKGAQLDAFNFMKDLMLEPGDLQLSEGEDSRERLVDFVVELIGNRLSRWVYEEYAKARQISRSAAKKRIQRLKDESLEPLRNGLRSFLGGTEA